MQIHFSDLSLPIHSFLKFFFKSFWRTHVLFWGHWYPCFGFLVTSALGFKARVGSALFAIFAEANVMYIPQDSPLVLHLLTSWWPARSRSLPHSLLLCYINLSISSKLILWVLSLLPLWGFKAPLYWVIAFAPPIDSNFECNANVFCIKIYTKTQMLCLHIAIG